MKTKMLTARVSSLNAASFRLVRVRDECGLVYLMRREIGTLGRLYAHPHQAVMTLPRRGRIRTNADVRTLHSYPSMRKRQHD